MTDLISRADAIEAVVSWTVEDRPHEVMPTDLVDRINALPSADAVSREFYEDAVKANIGLVIENRQLKEQIESADAVPQMEHDREWIIGCIKHDGFIKTDRFDKANQIILDALSGEAETKCVAQIKVDTEEIVRRIKEEYDITDGWIPCSERLPEEPYGCLVTVHWDDPHSGEYDEIYHETVGYDGEGWNDSDGWTLPYDVVAWMPLPKPYGEDGEV